MATNRLIAIVGPTASGKTSLAIRIAEQFDGEIICADSRTIYKGMDIGTAKPTTVEQARVKHWGLDLVEPGQPFSAADFKRYADDKIIDIQSRGKLPLLVGGTGLYVDSVLYDFTFGDKADDSERKRLEKMSLGELVEYCIIHNVKLPENTKNKRHLVRAIERKNISDISKSDLKPEQFIVGIATNMNTLRTRIIDRTEHLFANRVEQEATLLGKKYGWDSEAMTGNIYPLIKKHLDGTLLINEVKKNFITADYKLAKRQMTWFRRNPDIMWATLGDAEYYIKGLLATE
jgi:tRNA dimethylallyltransferase